MWRSYLPPPCAVRRRDFSVASVPSRSRTPWFSALPWTTFAAPIPGGHELRIPCRDPSGPCRKRELVGNRGVDPRLQGVVTPQRLLRPCLGLRQRTSYCVTPPPWVRASVMARSRLPSAPTEARSHAAGASVRVQALAREPPFCCASRWLLNHSVRRRDCHSLAGDRVLVNARHSLQVTWGRGPAAYAEATDYERAVPRAY